MSVTCGTILILNLGGDQDIRLEDSKKEQKFNRLKLELIKIRNDLKES
jgi:hypothetical protein